MNKLISVVITIVSIVILNSCITTPLPDPEKKTSQTVNINKKGDIVESTLTGVKNDTLKLMNVGDKIDFKCGVPFPLVINGFDPNYYKIVYYYDQDSESGFLTVEDIRKEEVITLKKKCDNFITTGDELPVIVVENDLKHEQVVVTPRYNKKCEFQGYEIRYGTTSRCPKLRDVFSQLAKCRDGSGRINKNDSKYWSKVLFGDD